jgi:hypothetical protein
MAKAVILDKYGLALVFCRSHKPPLSFSSLTRSLVFLKTTSKENVDFSVKEEKKKHQKG